jgi:hypothetical protein
VSSLLCKISTALVEVNEVLALKAEFLPFLVFTGLGIGGFDEEYIRPLHKLKKMRALAAASAVIRQ